MRLYKRERERGERLLSDHSAVLFLKITIYSRLLSFHTWMAVHFSPSSLYMMCWLKNYILGNFNTHCWLNGLFWQGEIKIHSSCYLNFAIREVCWTYCKFILKFRNNLIITLSISYNKQKPKKSFWFIYHQNCCLVCSRQVSNM